MWEIARNSVGLFFTGKLFAEPGKAYTQIAIGICVTALLLIGIVKLGLPLWAGGLAAGLVGGALQPYLFKDLRYR